MKSEELPKGYVCWTTEGLDLIESDVGKLKSDESSDESIIQAVHQHVDVDVKTNEVNASISSILEAGRKNRDTKIVEAFRASIKKEDIGSVLMSVVGINGSGKSHLVRWLYHEIVPNDEKYIKLWVPRRADGQKFLIKKLIDDLANLGSVRAVELRSKLEITVRESNDTPQAVTASLYSRIIDELQHDPDLRENKSNEESQYLKMFLGEVGDSSPRKFLWQVLNDVKNEDGELSDGLTTHLKLVVDSIGQLSNEVEGETHSTLDEKRVKKLLKAHQKVINEKLQRNSYEYLFTDALSNLSIVTDLLNRATALAVNSVLNVDGANIREVFTEVREELAKHGKTLLIFVEDFSAISESNAGLGKLQRDLMAMFTESSDGKLAPIRVAMAVTRQTFDNLESNFQQRMHFIIEIDDAFEDLRVEPFMASYLRLARTNKAELNAARNDATADQLDSGKWIPNKCDSCPYQEECFSVFEHEDGVGLYPLTKHALERISDRNRSTPRGRISRLKNVLMALQGDFSRDEMPSVAVEGSFGPSSGTAEWLTDRNEMLRIEFGLGDAAEGLVKSRLQRYVHNWSGGRKPSEVEFRVFNLPPFAGFADASTLGLPQPAVPTKGPIPSPVGPSRLQKDLDKVNLWLEAKPDEDLGVVFTANLESVIRRNIVAEVSASFGRQFTGATLEDYSKQIGLRFVDASIRIEGVPTQPPQGPGLLRPYFAVPRTEVGANILRGVLYLEAIKNGESIGSEISEQRRPMLLVAVGTFIRDIVEHLTLIVHEYEQQDDSLNDVTAKLLYFLHQVNSTTEGFSFDQIVSLWLSGTLEYEESLGNISESCAAVYRSMSELRNSAFALFQVTQQEGTSQDVPIYWRTIHLVKRMNLMESGPLETISSIDLDTESERSWLVSISTTLESLLQSLSGTELNSLQTKIHEDLAFVTASAKSNLVDQINWVKTNIEPLMSQSAFQVTKEHLLTIMNEISETFVDQVAQIKTLEDIAIDKLDADLVLRNSRDIDRLVRNAINYRILATQLQHAIGRLNSLSGGGVTTVVESVLDFGKLTTPDGVAELGGI